MAKVMYKKNLLEMKREKEREKREIFSEALRRILLYQTHGKMVTM